MTSTAVVPSSTTKKLEVGSIVKIDATETRFHECYGIIMDMNSDLRPEDGTIAVFFDQEVPDHEFSDHRDSLDAWKTKKPTPQNYKDCPRVMCFKESELEIIESEPIEILVRRKFGNNFHSIHSFSFPLKPHTHACQLKECQSDLPATHISLINVWGCIQTVYTCERCNSKYHGKRTDGVELKNPLPGSPLRT